MVSLRAMKRPSLKRKEKQPQYPWQKPPGAAPAAPGAPAEAGPKKQGRFARGKKPPMAQEQAPSASPAPDKKPGRAKGALAAPARLARKPVDKLGGLSGKLRIIVFGLLAIIVLFAALQLRGGRDDDKLVRQALERYEQASAQKDYQELCDELLASSYVKQTASSGLPCEVALRTALENVRNPTLDVLSVEVNGDRAAARVRGAAAGQQPGTAVYTLIREDDSWRILPPRAGNATP